MQDPIGDLVQQHHRLRAELERADAAAAGPELAKILAQMAPLVEEHARAKESFYRNLSELCVTRNDTVGGTLLRLFEANMTLLNRAIEQFFAAVKVGQETAALPTKYASTARLIRERMETEETAVFGIWRRHTEPGNPRKTQA